MSYTAIDRNQVSFYLFPINNNRTAWKPIGLPVLLVVPRRRTTTGIDIENSSISNVHIYIENVAEFAYVVGEDHILSDGTQLKYPSNELYRKTLYTQDLKDRLLDFRDLTYVDPTGEITQNPQPGDFIKFTTATKVIDTIPYYSDADYYDLSDVTIDIEILPPGYYNMVYSADFYYRNINTSDQSFICVNEQDPIAATFRFGIDHPGTVMQEMYRLTPPPYLTSAKKSEDTTIEFYRPFADAINDIYDEQKLLESINWVSATPLEVIPYLAFLLGWDLPYFPQTKGAKSLDSIRRAIIKTTVYFQNLRGSEKAITELFSIFGIEAYIERLWVSEDGKLLIRPNQNLPLEHQTDTIKAINTDQIDLLVNGFTANSSKQKIINPSTNQIIASQLNVKTNLLFTPNIITLKNNTNVITHSNDITIEAYTTTTHYTNTAGEKVLTPACEYLTNFSQNLYQDPVNYGQDSLQVTVDGIYINRKLEFTNADNDILYEGLLGKSTVRVSGPLGKVTASEHYTVSNNKFYLNKAFAPLNDDITYDVFNNVISFTYNGYVLPEQTVFIFAYYKRVNVLIPPQLEENLSNRFNLIVVTKANEEQVDSKTLTFAIDFLNKVKAFHSIVNLYRTSTELNETYEVTDLSIGGDTAQRSGTGIGTLQVPPAIIPSVICGDPIASGYKPTDIALRLRKLENLSEEQYVQYSLGHDQNARDDQNFGGRISPNKADTTATAGYYAAYGQTVIKNDRAEETYQKYHPNANANSHAYGTQNNPPAAEHSTINNTINVISTNRDSSSFGSFTVEKRLQPTTALYPLDGFTDYAYKGRVEDELLYRSTLETTDAVVLKTGPISMGSGVYYTFPRVTKQIRPNIASGNAKQINVEYYNQGVNKQYYNKRELSHYGRLLNAYKTTSSETLHFANRESQYYPDQLKDQAYQRPGINIEKPTMHLPGCRFPVMNKLTSDYVNNNIDARPWDDYICTSTPPLNLHLNNDRTQMVFNSASYKVAGNGQHADILNLGDVQNLDVMMNYLETDIVHKIYTSSAISQYVTLDMVDIITSDAQYEPPGKILFSTANRCNTNYQDYIDGYKSVYGPFSVTSTYMSDYDNEYMSFTDPVNNQFLYFLSSGIQINTDIRLDAGTGTLLCGTAEPASISKLDMYKRDGEYNFFPDIVDMTRILGLPERLHMGNYHCDGVLTSLMELM